MDWKIETVKLVLATPPLIQIIIYLFIVMSLGVCLLVALTIVAFFRRYPFEAFGVKIWTSGLACKTGVCHFPADHPADFEDGSVKGERSLERLVTFDSKFIEPPSVMIGVTRIDVGNGIVRLDVSPENVKRDGFTVRFKTWEDSRLYGASVSWIALGR